MKSIVILSDITLWARKSQLDNVFFCLFYKDDWPRLLKDKMKPGWLRIDFDKWIVDDSDQDVEKHTLDVRENVKP